jgi:hypothetical protein
LKFYSLIYTIFDLFKVSETVKEENNKKHILYFFKVTYNSTYCRKALSKLKGAITALIVEKCCLKGTITALRLVKRCLKRTITALRLVKRCLKLTYRQRFKQKPLSKEYIRQRFQ